MLKNFFLVSYVENEESLKVFKQYTTRRSQYFRKINLEAKDRKDKG